MARLADVAPQTSPETSPATNTAGASARPALRDRRGRGMRGPAYLPGPFAPQGVPARLSPAEQFDDVALTVMEDVRARWAEELDGLEVAVEEVPLLPPGWASGTVPLATFVSAEAGSPPRIVLFRRPIEHRAEGRAELEALVLTVIVEQVADVLGRAPEDIHPGYDPD
jgi:predicted Zn-dependent protease with MMP-like domain